MTLGTLEIHLRLDGCYSLKDKRHVVRSLLDKARRDFQVSAAEVEDHDLWNVSTVGIAMVGNDSAHIEAVLNKVLELFDSSSEAVVEGANRSIEHV